MVRMGQVRSPFWSVWAAATEARATNVGFRFAQRMASLAAADVNLWNDEGGMLLGTICLFSLVFLYLLW